MQVGGGAKVTQWEAIARGGITARANAPLFVNKKKVLAGGAMGYGDWAVGGEGHESIQILLTAEDG